MRARRALVSFSFGESSGVSAPPKGRSPLHVVEVPAPQPSR